MNIEIKISKKPISYVSALKYLEKRVKNIKLGINKDLIWILEHPKTYTAGIRFDKNEVLDKKIKIVKTNNTSVLDWSSSTGNPGNKLTYLVTYGLSHSDGTTGDAANSGKTSGLLTYIVPSTVDANFNGNDNFIIGPWDSDKLTTNGNHQSIHRIYYN